MRSNFYFEIPFISSIAFLPSFKVLKVNIEIDKTIKIVSNNKEI